MIYREYPIAKPLRPYVKVIWSLEGERSWATPMRILPDSCVEIVFHFAQPYQTTFSSKLTEVQPRSFVVAQMKSFIEIAPMGNIGMACVRLSAQGAYHFFDLPMREISNRVIDLNFVWKELVEEIEDKVAECKDTESRIDIIQQYLLLQLSRNGKTDTTMRYCLDRIYATEGRISIEDLSTQTGLSSRHLVRKFNDRIGMSPKEFTRIIKFISALRYMQQNNSLYLTDAAYDCGYYDQAHFIRDFKEYSGLTPTEYLKQDNIFF